MISDFGLEDEYVGVMKGVILNHCPTARIIDICHHITRQDIGQAARMLAASYPYFPPRTIHLAVVDPGVGTARKILVVEADEHLFIAPDNGLLTPLLLSKKLQGCFKLKTDPKIAVSATFHGRDIMAPAAAQLAAGRSTDELAEEIQPLACVTLALPSVSVDRDKVTGEITGIDHFGNVATSIAAAHLQGLKGKVAIDIGDATISTIARTYGEVAGNALVGVIDSRGNLEIARNMGNAAVYLGCRMGDAVVVREVAGNDNQSRGNSTT